MPDTDGTSPHISDGWSARLKTQVLGSIPRLVNLTNSRH